jgi:hypothetical protein
VLGVSLFATSYPESFLTFDISFMTMFSIAGEREREGGREGERER